jgi:tetratricopeptide (TPR) repeat protein
MVLALSWASPAAATAEGTVVASEQAGYGRIVFTLDKNVRATVRSSSAIVVLSFDEPVNVDIQRIPNLTPAYLSVARRDPDGRTIRFATKRPLRVNLMEAGEKIFLDLMPDNWQGMPPSLPADVVEELARRARVAEEQLRKGQRERERREVREMGARVASGPTFTRLVLDAGQTVPVEISKDGDMLTMSFDAALKLDAAALKAQLPEAVRTFTAETSAGMLKVVLEAEAGQPMRAFREDDTVVVDFPKSRDAVAPSEIVVPVPARPERASAPVQPAPAKAEPAKADVAPPPLRAQSDSIGVVRPQFRRAGNGAQIILPFGGMVPAAAFLRNDVFWMVFDTHQTIEAVVIPEYLRNDIARLDVDRAAGASIVRITLQNADAISFNPGENGGWVASLGRAPALPTEPLLLRRGVSDDGRTIMTARLPALGQVFWLDDPDTGDRLGIVTARGPAYGQSKTQHFVEFTSLPTAHGLAIAPRAEDLMVAAGLDEVRIGRSGGLSVSVGVADRPSAPEESKVLLLDVDQWRSAGLGSVRIQGNELLRAAADAPTKDRTEARLKLAQFRLATGDAIEAAGILRVVEQDDPTAVATKPLLLMRAIVAAETRQYKEAARLLNEPAIALETEAALWRGVIEARLGRWTPALVGFRQSIDALDRYPDELQTRIRELLVRAAIEARDLPFAAQQLDIYERLAGTAGAGQAALMRGVIAELQGKPVDAAQSYQLATRSPVRRVEAEARLRQALLMFREGKLDRNAAYAELETIKMIWRAGEIEVQALYQLGEMYAADNRWREAFGAARRTTEIMPDHPLSRQLHDTMAKRFEELFLEGKADNLSKIEAVGLFYDFRNLMPISRRGDEIVRRLAERLADLDLFDQATELLQHQVDNRLTGLQRARVAARLAVIHLMNRKPAEAVQTLKNSRANDLPEDVRRGRLILEARALSELSRTDLAIEMLSAQTGPDIDRLRADILWHGKRWREAGEALETVLGDRWQGPDELTDPERMDVMRAGVSYVLADDRLALDRLRQKFSPKMADSIDARPFALVAGESRARAREFREVARSVVSEDTLSEFLNVYRKRYPDAAGAPRNPRAVEDAVRERSQPRAPGQQQGRNATEAASPG